MLLPLQGALPRMSFTQGDALGYVLVAPSGRKVYNNCTSYFLHITKYTLYVNYHKVASGYKAFIENFPNDIQTVIKEMLLLASPLYYKNHKS